MTQTNERPKFIEQYLLSIDRTLLTKYKGSLPGFKVITVPVRAKGRAYPYLPFNGRAVLVDAPSRDHDDKVACDAITMSRVAGWLEAS
jgi:hypothetical protein